MICCVIWDFNGTLLDDVQAGIDSVNTLLVEREIPTVESVEKYREVFRFPIIDYYRALGFDFDAEPYEIIAHEWVENYRRLGAVLGFTPEDVVNARQTHSDIVRVVTKSDANGLNHADYAFPVLRPH